MEIAEILHEFERFTGRFPQTAVEAAVERREEVTPELLRILEDTVDRAAQFDAEGDYAAHLYAMFLLAQFRETRAYPLVLRFATLPGDLVDSLGGGFLTQGLGQVLASVCGGDLAAIQSLIENEGANQWVRGAALGSLVTLVATGHKSRDEIVNYFADLFRGKLVRQWSHVWDELVSHSADLYPAELLDDIERAYREGLVDPGYIGFDDIKRDLAMGKDWALAKLTAELHLVDDTVAEFGWWACFHEDDPDVANGSNDVPVEIRSGSKARPHRPSWDWGRTLGTASGIPLAVQTTSRCPRSEGQRRRPVGTIHVLAVAVRNTRSAAAHDGGFAPFASRRTRDLVG